MHADHDTIMANLSVCLSVRPSVHRTYIHRAGRFGGRRTVRIWRLLFLLWYKWMHISSNSFHHLLGHGISFDRYRRYKIPAGGVKYPGWENFAIFDQNRRYI